ncbi:MAG: hopanoid biosynthesis associated radical SAM protein HpnJ [Armatimonadota bacterium]
MKTLFLNPPSFQGFDGGAGSRYQAKREIKSFWYPTWLAQAAALVEYGRVIDAPADDLTVEQVLNICADYDLIIIYTSTPSFANDSRLADKIKQCYPDAVIGFVGPHVSVLAEESLSSAKAVDFVVRREFEIAVQQISQGQPLRAINGISWRDGTDIRHNSDSELIRDLDALPSVIDIYKRDLTVENYYIGYLMHPYLSIYTGRGCPGRCTYCLWPQTISGHEYRVRSPRSVCKELARAKDMFPQVKEFFIDDDTFTANTGRAEETAKLLGSLGIMWSTSSRANVPYDTLKALKESGLRLLMVGYESGSDDILKNVRKGISTDMARRFTKDCKSLDIAIHGTFCLGLPGETKQTIEQTIRYACELGPDTIQVSIAAPYPGTEFYDQAVSNGWLAPSELVSQDGTQVCPMHYENISADEISEGVDRLYKRFYFRPKVMARIALQMAKDSEVRKRRLREGKEFLGFLKQHRNSAQKNESTFKQVMKNGGPGFCQFAITDACNAACKFCNFRVDMSMKRTYVSLENAVAAQNILARNGIRYIAYIGGEPTIHPSLADMITHAKSHGMKTIICTNGSVLSGDRISEYVEAGLDSAIISVDAPSVEAHEQNRGIDGLCSRIAYANIILHDAGVETTASVTLSKLLGDLSRLPDFLESLNFRQVTFSYPLKSLGSSFRSYSDSDLLDYTDDELVDAFENVIKMKRRFRVVNPTASLREMQRFIRGEKQRFPCLAGLKYFYLDWNLDMYRCHAWPERMCSIFDFDSSKLVRDGCTRCMIDCYRDASVLHEVGMAIFDAKCSLFHGCPGKAAARLFNTNTFEAAKSVLEDMSWIKKL